MKRVLPFISSIVYAGLLQANAAPYTININDVYSGDTPAGPTPYLVATLEDIAGGDVRLVLSAPNLGATEFVGVWGFNINPSLLPNNLTFLPDGEVGDVDLENFHHVPANPNDFNLGPEKDFDFVFDFQTSNSDGGRFQDGESIAFILHSTAASLTATDFLFPNGNSDKISAAHIQGIAGTGQGSSWVSGGADDVVPPDGTPVPDGGLTVALLGLGLASFAALRKLS